LCKRRVFQGDPLLVCFIYGNFWFFFPLWPWILSAPPRPSTDCGPVPLQFRLVYPYPRPFTPTGNLPSPQDGAAPPPPLATFGWPAPGAGLTASTSLIPESMAFLLRQLHPKTIFFFMDGIPPLVKLFSPGLGFPDQQFLSALLGPPPIRFSLVEMDRRQTSFFGVFEPPPLALSPPSFSASTDLAGVRNRACFFLSFPHVFPLFSPPKRGSLVSLPPSFPPPRNPSLLFPPPN